ncbi:MAG: phytanoyl-CoA dioxygenase family protein [Nakamurella sp.]
MLSEPQASSTSVPASAADAPPVIPPRSYLEPLRHVRKALRSVRTESRAISRYVFNAAPVWKYRRAGTPLDGEMQRVALELRRTGVAMTSVESLLGSGEALVELQASVAAARIERTTERDPLKPYLIELFGARPVVAADDPVFAFALRPQIRGVAEAYAQMRLRVQDLNVWINLPTGGGPTQSQRWHRDLPDDFEIIKCFVYLADVTPGAGPLQYIRTTNTVEGRRQWFQSEFDGVGYRVADEDIAATYAPEEIVVAEGSAGTIVFADTRGLHRGGFAFDTERVVMQITYSSNASIRPRNLRAPAGATRSELVDYRLMSSR